MTIPESLEQLKGALRLRHFSYATENACPLWLQSYMEAVRACPPDWSSEKKVEVFLTSQARDIQLVPRLMQLETTMRYLSPTAGGIRSPLD